MNVRQLIEFLQKLPPDAHVHVDEESYPEVDGCCLMDPAEYEGDEEERPPLNVVLLEVTYPTEN